jgi:hypothetical protein
MKFALPPDHRIFVVIFVACAVAGLLAACAVKPEVWKRAEELCEKAGGVAFLADFSGSGNTARAICKDGTRIDITITQ